MVLKFIKKHPSGGLIGQILVTENLEVAKSFIKDGYAEEFKKKEEKKSKKS